MLQSHTTNSNDIYHTLETITSNGVLTWHRLESRRFDDQNGANIAELCFDEQSGGKKYYRAELWSKVHEIQEIHYFGNKISGRASRTVQSAYLVTGYNRENFRVFIDDLNDEILGFYGRDDKVEVLYGSIQPHNCAIIVYWSYLLFNYGMRCYYYHDRTDEVHEVRFTNFGYWTLDQVNDKITKIKGALRCPAPKVAFEQETKGSFASTQIIKDTNIINAQKGDHLMISYKINGKMLWVINTKITKKKRGIYCGDRQVIDLDDGVEYSWYEWTRGINQYELEIKYDILPRFTPNLAIYRARNKLRIIIHEDQNNYSEHVRTEKYNDNAVFGRNKIDRYSNHTPTIIRDKFTQNYMPKMNDQYEIKFNRYYEMERRENYHYQAPLLNHKPFHLDSPVIFDINDRGLLINDEQSFMLNDQPTYFNNNSFSFQI